MYHKKYDPHGPEQEKQLKEYCKVVKSEEEFLALGSDWVSHGDLGKHK